MADISREIRDFREAVYGEEVRGSMISLAEKVNSESTASKEAAEGHRDSAKAAALAASALVEKAATASDTAVQKATEAGTSAEVASQKAAEAANSALKAKESENNTKISETNTKASETAAKESETKAEAGASTASQKAADASLSADAAKASEENAAASKNAAAESEKKAEDFYKKSKSYAVGTGNEVREDDATDNSKAYKEEAQRLLEEAKRLLASITAGGLIPAGTVAFEDLPENPNTGYMYNIANDFTSDTRFADGAGIFYKAGANVYWSAEGKWDVLAGVQVTGVRGAAEKNYRSGNVTITKENIGLENVSDLENDAGYVTTDTWKANSAESEGYVPATGKMPNRVYGTDAEGNPGWQEGVNVDEMTGATEEVAGTGGIVPTPPAGMQKAVLQGNGQWGNLGAAAYFNVAENDAVTEDGFLSNAKVVSNLRKIIDAQAEEIKLLNSAQQSNISLIEDVSYVIAELKKTTPNVIGMLPDHIGYDKMLSAVIVYTSFVSAIALVIESSRKIYLYADRDITSQVIIKIRFLYRK